MFNTDVYKNRRNNLKGLMRTGIGFFPGNTYMAMNYPSNTYPFRQDSNFLYYFGVDQEDLAAVIDFDSGEEIIFGNDRELDDVVWMGPDTKISAKAESAGVENSKPISELDKFFEKARNEKRQIHYLPPYQGETSILISNLTGININRVKENASEELIKAVISQRSIKESCEIEEIEKALAVSYEMNTLSMKMTAPDMYERGIYGAAEGIALALGSGVSFPIIFSVHGETLHNHHHDNLMKAGDIAVLDSGAESPRHYASDITRTIPVSGKFTDKQKEIYNIVLKSQTGAISMMQPGIKYRDIHLYAAKIIFNGLKALGLTKGDPDDAVMKGAHALFFPHGLGHMMGLDVHDMEGLGENLVGYDNSVERSEQFGLAYLRFAKKMQPGHVLTVEPGIYFIPQLIDNWKSENKLAEFINYDKVEEYMNFGGIRIEDDILVTEEGGRVLGQPIPKTIKDVEAMCQSK